MAQEKFNELYELKGRSLAAALVLEQELAVEIDANPPLRSGNMGEIGRSWQALYTRLQARLETEDPEILDLTGLKAPAIRVYKGVQSYPRAYEEFPAIFSSPRSERRYFMYSPIDYKGQHYVPEDAKLIDNPKEIAAIGDLLFAGGWLGNSPLVDKKNAGVATPSDYKPPSISKLREQFSHMPNDRRVYIAQGQSLENVEHFKNSEARWRNAVDATLNEIKSEIEKLRPQILESLPAGEDYYINSSYSYGGKSRDVEIMMSLRCAGKLSMLTGGKPIKMPYSPAFKTQDGRHGDSIITPRRNTPEGKTLTKLFDAIPPRPTLGDYPDFYANFEIEKSQFGHLLGENGVLPQLQELEGYSFLIYNASPENKDDSFCPPDSLPVPAEVYEWFKSDAGDRNMGIKLPPQPAAMTALLSTIQSTLRDPDDNPAPEPG